MAYTLAEQKALEAQRQGQTNSHSEIDNLIGMNDLKQWWDSTKNKNILGQETSPLSEDELLDIVMSFSTPAAGTISAGKGIMSILKRLLSKSSKSKFPIAYGRPTKPTGKLGGKIEAEKELLEELGFTKGGQMTEEAKKLFGTKSTYDAPITPRKVWK